MNINGILCVDKPAGFTSFDVIAKLRGILKMKRLGHAGTLDPMATGVLLVFVGYATKACGILPNENKHYIAEFQLGKISDTQDSTGKILETRDFTGISKQDILNSISTGEIMQIPPMYSAVSVNGKRLYELAREGKEIKRQARPVFIKSVSCMNFNAETGTGVLNIHCGKGTYVRTFIHDMGQSLGCGALMTNLRRSYASGFDLNSCYSLEEIQKFADNNMLTQIIIPIEKAFDSLPVIELNIKQTRLYRNGVKLDLSQFAINFKSQQYAVYSISDGFLGTALPDLEQNCLRIERNLCEPK